MHLPILTTLLLLVPATLALPIPSSSNPTNLEKRDRVSFRVGSGSGFKGDCWVLRNPNGSTRYSNRYLGPGSHFRVGCMQGEREARRGEAEETRKRLEVEAKRLELSEGLMGCFDVAEEKEEGIVGDNAGMQKIIGEEVSGEDKKEEVVIRDRVALVEKRLAIQECRKMRVFDERAIFKMDEPSFGTKRACKGDIGRLDLINVCLNKVRGYPGPYV